MTKHTILVEHNLDLFQLGQSAHEWIDETINIFSKQFWANLAIVANLRDWSTNYKPSPQLLLKYALMKELELEESRAPCDQSASTTDKLVKRITDLPPFNDFDGDEGREQLIDSIISIFDDENYEGNNPGYEILADVW